MATDKSNGRQLEAGEQKSRRDQNVRYAWGPAEEVGIVRQIFRMYVRRALTTRAIAAELNAEGRLWHGEPWNAERVLRVLRCELAIGDQVFNTNCSQVGEPRRQLRQSEWMRISVLPPMVSPRLFRTARRIRRRTVRRERSRDAMLADLRRILQEKGKLSTRLIRSDPHALSAHFYTRDFGSVAEAYRQAGYAPPSLPALHNRFGEAMTRADILEGMRRLYREQGRITAELMSQDHRLPHHLQLYGEFGSLPAAYVEAGLPLSKSGRRVQQAGQAAASSHNAC